MKNLLSPFNDGKNRKYIFFSLPKQMQKYSAKRSMYVVTVAIGLYKKN